MLTSTDSTKAAKRAVRLPLLGLALVAAGCTMTERFENGRLTVRSFGFGTVAPPSCVESGGRAQVTNLGLAVAGGETIIGYRSTDLLCLPLASCGTVFFAANDVQVAQIRERFPDLESACVISDDP